MIDLKKFDQIDTVLCDVVENFKVLHFDEFPIIYVGSNVLGNHIIGSLIEETENDELVYFRSLISPKNLNSFLSGKESYRSILKSAVSIYIIIQQFNEVVTAKYNVKFENIPSDYLPLETAYCPTHLFDKQLKFSISLQGARADLHEAFASSVSKISQSFSTLVDDAFESVNQLGLTPRVVLEPFSRGSFRLDFVIKVDSFQNIFIQQQEVNNYIVEYIDYCIDDLYQEVKEVNKDSSEGLQIEPLLNRRIDILEKMGYEFSKKEVKKHLIPSVYKSLKHIDKISEEVGNGFKQLEILSTLSDSEKELPIGFIDGTSSFMISKAYDYVSEFTKLGEVVKLPKQDFKIHIYNLNTDTRVGNAYITNFEDDNIVDKPRIEIGGDIDLSESIYTESIHFNKWIVVKGTAEIKKGKFRRINIIEAFE